MRTIEIGCPENMRFDPRVKLPSDFHKLYLKVKRISYFIENEGNVNIAVCARRAFSIRFEVIISSLNAEGGNGIQKIFLSFVEVQITFFSQRTKGPSAP